MVGRPTKCPSCGFIDWTAAPETAKVWDAIRYQSEPLTVKDIQIILNKKKQVITHQLRALERLELISIVKKKLAGRNVLVIVAN